MNVIDQSNTTGATAIGFGDVGSGRDYMSQGFIGRLNNITHISFYINGKSGTSTQGYKLWVDNADSNSAPTGTVFVGIGGATEILNSTLVTGALTKYTLTTPVTGLVPGNRYCFVLAPFNTTTHTYSADYQDFISSTGNPYPSGKRNHGDTAYTTWSAPDSGNDDLQFEIWGDDGNGGTSAWITA